MHFSVNKGKRDHLEEILNLNIKLILNIKFKLNLKSSQVKSFHKENDPPVSLCAGSTWGNSFTAMTWKENYEKCLIIIHLNQVKGVLTQVWTSSNSPSGF